MTTDYTMEDLDASLSFDNPYETRVSEGFTSKQDYIQQEQTVTDHSAGDILEAAFATENSVGSIITSGMQPTNLVDQKFNPFNYVDSKFTNASSSEKGQYKDALIGVFNSKTADHIIANVQQETQYKKVLMESGAWGMGATMTAAMTDPVDWLMMYVTGGLAGAAKLSKTGKIVAEGVAGAAAQEAVLQLTQETRTKEDALYSVGGALVGNVAMLKTADLLRGINGVAVDKMDNITFNRIADEELANVANPEPRHLSAAATDHSLRNRGDGSKLAGDVVFRENAILRAIRHKDASELKRINLKDLNPFSMASKIGMRLTMNGRIATSSSKWTRNYGLAFNSTNWKTREHTGNIEAKIKDFVYKNKAKPNKAQLESIKAEAAKDAVARQAGAEDYIKVKQDAGIMQSVRNIAEFHAPVAEEVDHAVFDKLVGISMRNGDDASSAIAQFKVLQPNLRVTDKLLNAVTQSAKAQRKIVNKVTEDLQSVGLAPEIVDDIVAGAESYLGRVYDRETINKNRTKFELIIANAHYQHGKRVRESFNKFEQFLTARLGDDILTDNGNLSPAKISDALEKEAQYLVKEARDYKAYPHVIDKFLGDLDGFMRQDSNLDLLEEVSSLKFESFHEAMDTFKTTSDTSIFKKKINTYLKGVEVKGLSEGDKSKLADSIASSMTAKNITVDRVKGLITDLKMTPDLDEEAFNSFVKQAVSEVKAGKLVGMPLSSLPGIHAKQTFKDLVEGNIKDIVKDINSTLKKTPETRAEYNALATSMADTILHGKMGGEVTSDAVQDMMFKKMNKNVPSSVKSRVVKATDNDMQEFLVQDSSVVLQRMVQDVIPKVEGLKAQKRMGVENPTDDLSELKKHIREEYKQQVFASNPTSFLDEMVEGAKLTHLDETDSFIINKPDDILEYYNVFRKIDIEDSLGKIAVEDYDKLIKTTIASIKQKDKSEFTREELVDMFTLNGADDLYARYSKRLNKTIDQELDDVETLYKLHTNVPLYDANTTGGAALRELRSVNYMSMLGSMAISALPDLAAHVVSTGARVGIEKARFGKVMETVFLERKGKGYTREMLEHEGIVTEMAMNSRGLEMIDRALGIQETNRFSQGMRKLEGVFTKASLMDRYNQANKSFNVITNMDTVARISLLDEIPHKDLLVMKKLGLNEEDLKIIGEQYAKYGQDAGDVGTPVYDLGIEKWDDIGQAEKLRSVLRREADNLIVTPSVGDRPSWMARSEVAKSITQFMSFMFAAGNKRLISGMTDADKRYFASLTLQLGLGFGVTELKNAMKEKEYQFEDRLSKSYILEGIDRSGTLPLLAMGIRVMQASGLLDTSRFEQQSAASSFSGVSAGTVERMFGVASSGFDWLNNPNPEAAERSLENAVKQGSRLLPFQNLWAIQLFGVATGIDRKDIIEDIIE